MVSPANGTYAGRWARCHGKPESDHWAEGEERPGPSHHRRSEKITKEPLIKVSPGGSDSDREGETQLLPQGSDPVPVAGGNGLEVTGRSARTRNPGPALQGRAADTAKSRVEVVPRARPPPPQA